MDVKNVKKSNMKLDYVGEDFKNILPGTICLFENRFVIFLNIGVENVRDWRGTYLNVIFRHCNLDYNITSSRHHEHSRSVTLDLKFSRYSYLIVLDDSLVPEEMVKKRDEYMNSDIVQKKLLKWNKDE
jgi:hypothetical protein